MSYSADEQSIPYGASVRKTKMLAKKKWLSNSQKYNGLGTVRNTMVEQQSEIRLLRNRQKYNG